MGHENRVSCLGVSNDGISLCTGSWDSLVRNIPPFFPPKRLGETPALRFIANAPGTAQGLGLLDWPGDDETTVLRYPNPAGLSTPFLSVCFFCSITPP